MTVLGADPGANGAITILDGICIRPIKWDYVKRHVVKEAIEDQICGDMSDINCYFPKTWGRRGDFVNKAFEFGRSTGKMECVIEDCGITIVWIDEKEVKKMFGLLGRGDYKDNKNRAWAAAKEILPDIPKYAADSLLIAKYGEMKELEL